MPPLKWSKGKDGHLHRRLKKLRFDREDLSKDLREELAPWVYRATFQPVSSFMNSLRERISVAARPAAPMHITHHDGPFTEVFWISRPGYRAKIHVSILIKGAV